MNNENPAPLDMGPLDGIRVVDLSQGVAGPFCARLMADYGADVIKVEPPQGDESRHAGPFPHDEPDPERSGLFLHLNTNKRGIVVDSQHPAGVDVVRRLVAEADVVVESARPADVADTGLAPAALLTGRDDLVVTSVTPFGQDGPYRDYRMSEIVAFAMGGPMNSSGTPDREPVKMAGNAIGMQSGATALTATLGALFHAQTTGQGQHVDVATYETQNGSLDRRRYYLLSYQYSGFITQRANKVGSGRIAVGGRFPTRDGRMITTGAVWPTHLPRMVSVLADEQLSARFASEGENLVVEQPELVNAAIAGWAGARDARVAMREAQSAGWPVVVVNDPKTLLTDEHLVARGFWVTGSDSLVHTGAPWKIDGGGWSLRRPAPRLGEHTDEVLREIGLSPDELRTEGVVR